MRFDLWAATSYGQNLDVKELRGRNRGDEGPKRDDATFAHSHCLDDDRASVMPGARSDVTGVACGKRWERCVLSWLVRRMRVESPPKRSLDRDPRVSI
jgi:hypothetical protein